MKSLLIIICVLAFAHLSFSQGKIPHSIKITYVDCSIETVIDISCGMFENQFSKQKKYRYIADSELLKSRASLKNFIKVKSNGD